MAQHFHLFRFLAISRESCSACPTLLFPAETQPYFALLYGRQRPTQVILVLWDHRFTKNPTNSCPHPQCAKWKSLPEPQGSTRMGVNEERSGRCSSGHHFQEDYTYEHAVPSDRSLAASAAQKWLSAVILHTGICFPLNFPGVAFRKQPHRHFPCRRNCTRFLSRCFCQAEIPHANGLVGRSRAGLGDCSFAGRGGGVGVRKAKGKGGNRYNS